MVKYFLLDLTIIENYYLYLNELFILLNVLPVRQLEILSQWLSINNNNDFKLFYSAFELSKMRKSSNILSDNKYNFDKSGHYILNDEKDITYFLVKNYPKLFQTQEQAFNVFKRFKNIQARKKRCKKKVSQLINYSLSKGLKPVFATFTISPEYYNKSLNYYLLRLKRLLKNNFDKYIINVDYGLLNERLHFHCVLSDTIKDLSKWSKDMAFWGIGAINCEKIRVNNKTVLFKINNYLNKLSNHALKDTTKQTKLIYSR